MSRIQLVVAEKGEKLVLAEVLRKKKKETLRLSGGEQETISADSMVQMLSSLFPGLKINDSELTLRQFRDLLKKISKCDVKVVKARKRKKKPATVAVQP